MAMIQIWRHPPNEYLTLIGHFIVSMSHTETYLKQLLWKHAELGDKLGPLLLGGAPLDNIAWLLRKIIDSVSQNQLVVDDIEGILAEAADLKLSRDQIAHRQWHSNQLGIVLSNRALAKTAEAIEETPYTLQELETLCIRAHVLNGRVLRHLVAHPAIDVIEQNWRGQYELPPATWLGKWSPRVDRVEKKRKGQDKSRKHVPPPQSSGE